MMSFPLPRGPTDLCLTRPFVWGSQGTTERGREGEKKGGKGTQQRPYVQCDPHYSQLGQPSMEWSC